MATQIEIQQRLNNFIKIINDNPDGINKKELCEKLNIKIRSLEGMRNSLCQKGYCIRTSGKGVGIWWRDKSTEEIKDFSEPSSTKLYAEAAVYLYLLQTSSELYTKEGLFQKIRSLNKAVYEENRVKLYASQSDKFKKIIKILKEEGQISIVTLKDGKEYIKPGKEAFVCLPVLSESSDEDYSDSAYKLLDSLQYYSGNFDKNLISVKSKLELLLAGEENEQRSEYEIRGRQIDMSQIAEEIKTRIGNCNYTQNEIRISYYNGKKMTKEYNIKIGLIYYSKNQNTVYILGEKTGGKKIYNLRLSNIGDAKDLKTKNDVYFSDKYLDIFDKMFGASYEDEEYYVKVEFEKTDSMQDKIRQLCNTRKNSLLREESGKLIYTDKIIGISEFAAYLRQFGEACKVIEPQVLRDEMAKSPNNVLKRYKEEGLL